jgi:hypothetical protein
LTNAELGNIGGISADKLYGVELNDVLEMKVSIDVKQVQVDQPWTEMGGTARWFFSVPDLANLLFRSCQRSFAQRTAEFRLCATC